MKKITVIYEGESVDFVLEINENHEKFNTLKQILFWLKVESKETTVDVEGR